MTIYTEGFLTTSTDAGAVAVSLTSTEEEPKHADKIKIEDESTQPIFINV
ncbi:unnamed protein product [marine sediment metagenome]|uniref:Uncharacterized protein n=1 Tax=marine sediment metagenome TaxID=412755 RepID=X1IHI7_9ZZZZ